MNRIEQVFGIPRVLLPVIHSIGPDEALASIGVAHSAGIRGVFLIDQGTSEDEVIDLILATHTRYPDLWIGINLLARSPSEMLVRGLESCGGRLDGIWCDNAGIDGENASFGMAQELLETRRRLDWNGLYFGGVAFKYQRPILFDDLARISAAAASLMDVVCTSGPGTGVAADLKKVIAMNDAIGPDGVLALASGVTQDNVADYLPYVCAYLVASGIEKEFGVLDASKVSTLRVLIETPG